MSSPVTVVQCDLSDMDIAIEDFTRNLGPTTLNFLNYNRGQLRFTIHADGNTVEVLPRDGEECVFETYELAVAVDRAFVAVAVAQFNYDVAKAQREPRSLRVQLLLARYTALREATKAVRAFSTALALFEEALVEEGDMILSV
ncbi:hypothetical protein GGX14DRAFT_393991 [Mycena pura]|uniref:Uncharacterized protein n=1 Tax=Mycena pura TaxID=153505 RepID=A0AAD6VJQ5_9AGAR|nr:hypothetical protein GGX14DRAFT_393991 [Mycena pura]